MVTLSLIFGIAMPNSIEVEYYAPQFNGDTANLIWTDIDKNVDCVLDCDLDKETIIKIVENIIFE